MSKKNFESLVDLSKALNKKSAKLEKGKLSFSDINEMYEKSRDIYERLTILRYKALLEKQEISKEISEEVVITKEEVEHKIEESNFSFNFDMDEEEIIEISPNQRNLLDEIQEIGGEGEEEQDKTSLNDQYASSTDKPESLGEKLTKTKINDLRKAVALNQKFLFMNDLFGGEKEIYDLVIDKINSFDSIIEARAYLNSEIENKYNWDSESKSVQQFVSLVERKFL